MTRPVAIRWSWLQTIGLHRQIHFSYISNSSVELVELQKQSIVHTTCSSEQIDRKSRDNKQELLKRAPRLKALETQPELLVTGGSTLNHEDSLKRAQCRCTD